MPRLFGLPICDLFKGCAMKWWTFAALACAFFNASHAVAAFVDGVERFNGTTKDLTTWEQFPVSGSGITQSDALNITGSGDRDYTTRGIKVGIGQRVTAE